jgi:uncharacterized membrane protein YjdF
MILDTIKKHRILLAFNILYVLAFTVYYISIENYEFLWYVAVLVAFLVLIIATLHRSRFDSLILWGLSIWGLLHMAGGGIIVNGGVLYELTLVPLFESGDFILLKYDQLVHFYGFGVATLVVYHVLRPYLNEYTNWKIVYSVIVLAGMGLGALNEIIEFTAVLSFSDTNVGGYFNTSLDLVFNTLGAIAATFLIHARRKREAAIEPIAKVLI